MRQPRHQRTCVKLVHLLFKFPDHHHAPIDSHPLLGFDAVNHCRFVSGNGHLEAPDTFVDNPDIWAKTSKTTAKSFSTKPIPRAAVKNSFVTAVVGIGTSSCRPSSSVSTSTAVSRLIPLFSARSTPSQNASICTARLRFTPIFITRACPFSPTCVTFGPISSSSG